MNEHEAGKHEAECSPTRSLFCFGTSSSRCLLTLTKNKQQAEPLQRSCARRQSSARRQHFP